MEPDTLEDVKLPMGEVIRALQTRPGTALYTAVQEAVRLTNAAPGDVDATRAVVVLSDGEATAGICLDELVDDVIARGCHRYLLRRR